MLSLERRQIGSFEITVSAPRLSQTSGNLFEQMRIGVVGQVAGLTTAQEIGGRIYNFRRARELNEIRLPPEELFLPAHHLHDVGRISPIELKHRQVRVDGVQQRRDAVDELRCGNRCDRAGEQCVEVESSRAVEPADLLEILLKVRNQRVLKRTPRTRAAEGGASVRCPARRLFRRIRRRGALRHPDTERGYSRWQTPAGQRARPPKAVYDNASRQFARAYRA
jgi:hypothetical protein